MTTTVREIVAGLAASATFLWLVSGAGIVWWGGLLLAGGVYGGLRLLLPGRQGDPRDEVAPGITRAQLEQVTDQVAGIADRFVAAAAALPESETSHRIDNIGRISHDMVANFHNDPGDLHLAGDFLALHLPKALRIVERFTDLATQPHLDQVAQDRLRDAEETIVMIEAAFARQYRLFLEQDFRDFQIDQRVFQELLVLDGLETDDPPSPREQEGERS